MLYELLIEVYPRYLLSHEQCETCSLKYLDDVKFGDRQIKNRYRRVNTGLPNYRCRGRLKSARRECRGRLKSTRCDCRGRLIVTTMCLRWLVNSQHNVLVLLQPTDHFFLEIVKSTSTRQACWPPCVGVGLMYPV